MPFKKTSAGEGKSFNKKSSYKTNKENVEGSRSDLYDVFWKELRKRRTFHEGQEEIFDAFFEKKMKYLFFRMGRKGAKTAANIVAAWGYCLLNPRSTCFVTLPTITQAIEVYWDENRLQWCDLPDPDLFDMFVKQTDKSKHILTFVNDSSIKLLGTWSEARGRGTQPNLLIVDEVQDCNADYLDGMEPNLAAKEDARCIMSGTPPKKLNHYHTWEDRIRNNDEGICFHYSSYINTCLPHLAPWLDKKHKELVDAGKEDQWIREYLAEDCFSSDERVLPDVSLVDYDEMLRNLKSVDPTAFVPILSVVMTEQTLCASYGVMLQRREFGTTIKILEMEVTSRLWDTTISGLYDKMREKMEGYSRVFTQKWHMVLSDETESFADIVTEIRKCRTDIKWKKRGIPLLKEMILTKNIEFSTKCDQFGVESQNLLKEDNIMESTTVCNMAMLANEYYQAVYQQPEEKKRWDELAPLREAGIVCYPKKTKNKHIMSINWD